ncbi:MAG: membrane protein insertase YidC [Bacteroidales bacterium]|jgi:YidC/Oxa1 family membrane protein insertase
MDKNTIIGLVLIFLVFIGFGIYNGNRFNNEFRNAVKSAETDVTDGNLDKARAEYVNALKFKPNQPDVLAKIQELDAKLGNPSGGQTSDTSGVNRQQKALAESGKPAEEDASQYGAFAGSARGEDGFLTLENNKIQLKISLRGGRVYSARLKDYKTYNALPLVLFDGDSTIFGFDFFTADNKAVRTNNLYFRPVSGEKSVFVTNQPGSIKLRLYADSDRFIEYKYTLAPDKYSVAFDVTFENLQEIMPANQNNISVEWKMYLPQQEKGRQNEENYVDLKYKNYQDEVEDLKLRQQKEIEKQELTTRLSWIAYVDQFFSSVLITDGYFLNASIASTRTLTSEKYLRYFASDIGVPFTVGKESKIGLKFYFGPNDITTLRKEGYQLDKIIFLGRNIIAWISRFVIIPAFNWLSRYINNYGLIILILTIAIKIVLFPLTFKSYQSTAKMQVLKPLVDELSKKYPKQEDSMKKQQATMDLYKRAGVNPMGGCLPMLLQFPILFAMFRFFPVSIELRQQHFLWATDLSTYDSILSLPFKIPIFGNHVSLFNLLMTASSLLTINQSGQSQQTQPGMKMMTWMMPIMFMLMFNNFSSGLTYYYFLANIITWLQNFIFKKMIDADKIMATLEANRKKPITKSRWQQRLEEAAKQRGINSPKR